MIATIIFLCFSLMVNCSPPNLRGGVDRRLDTMTSFSLLAESYGRLYSDEEFQLSFKAYEENLKLVASHNAAELAVGGSAVFALNFLFDRQMQGHLKIDSSYNFTTEEFNEVTPYLGSERVVDWTGIYTTPVKDEINCWSCWAFPSTEQLESDSIRTLGFTTNDVLSAQQLISCTTTNNGCADGSMQHAYGYIKHAGLQRESTYPLQSPLTGTAGACSATSQNFIVSLSSFHYLRRGDEEQIANYILSTGTLLKYF